MRILPFDDPRDPLDRAFRDDMWAYAEKHGIKEIEWWMAGNQMREILRAKGVRDIVPQRELGGGRNAVPAQSFVTSGPTVSVQDMERAQWEQQAQDALARQKKTEEPKTRAALAKECKQRGIKFARTDKKEKLMELLSG